MTRDTGTDLAASYTYDDAGNVTRIDNNPTATGAPARDTQCFTNDGLGRLTSAWTPQDASCTTAKTVPGLGGPAQYWMDYTYDPVGNRTSVTEHTTSGTSTASYTYPAPGQEQPHAVTQVTNGTDGTAVSSYAYDASGNTTTRAPAGAAAQTLTWDAEGELAQVTGDGETDASTDASFVYTADGDRLIRKQDGTTTVHLPGGQELTLTAAGTTKATRYYTWAGQTIAVRTGAGFDDVSTLVNDHHGTAGLSITNVTATITHRYQDPFGNTRGTTPTAWSGDHGFLDKPTDTTGLTAIGARYYDPTIGRFTSVDPIMDLADPQQWHGYAYANNNPVTLSDPTGLRPVGAGHVGYTPTKSGPQGGDPCAGAMAGCGGPKPPVRTKDSGDGRASNGGSPSTANSSSTQSSVVGNSHEGVIEEIVTWARDFEQDHPILAGVLGIEDAIGCLVDGRWQSCAWLLASFIPAGKLARLGKAGFEVADAAIDGTRAANAAGRSADEVIEGAGAACRLPNSFDAGTLVLMADGTRKSIEDVELGDEVIATDPETGERGSRKVIDVIRHGGVHTMVDIEFFGGGQVDATDEHPFWVVSEDAWVDAIDLAVGDVVVTASGSTLNVTSVRGSRYDLMAYNLTIADLHTYHVSADAILVHNAGDDSPVGEVFRDGAYRFQIFSNDHAPAHGHLQGPGIKGHGIQIGQNGKPLDPNIELNSAQQRVVDSNLKAIRSSIRGYMSWYKQNPGC
ncbi:hypothetical protein LEP48_04095 [Isoptericola sp. NEAU-Y5]|uniref:Hint domain-containing protein n=1 Tax=Isoptericola luteus TaxID=2879484 RepID=A0ABS7ZFC2_9MICO|nr:polymorphic toxin-type HINT domain-containing protein [Isoptericola sp. NEAU-Y5]MCA5892534.1 hypothetical protein [Isoptericola sp. NEAU-Y5]